MKGTEKIIAHIEADARAEAQTILDKAAEEVEDIRAAGNSAAQDEYWKLVRAGVKDCEDMVARKKRIAVMESKKDILSLKQEKVSAAFDKAQAMITALPEADYTAFLARLAAEGSANGLEEVVFNAKDKAGCAKAAVKAANARLTAEGKTGKLTVSEDIADITGGLILRQGGIECNCSVETLVELRRSNMSSELAAVLFE